VSITTVVLLVSDYIFSRTTAIATTASLTAVFVALWYGLPLHGWLRQRD
jgi:hypothetical protein